MSVEKDALRHRFDAYRRSLPSHSYERLSEQIVDRLIKLPEIASASIVHIYWPILARREVDTRRLIHWLEAHQKEIVLPVVTNFRMEVTGPPRLEHVRYPGKEGLRVNQWGISEPHEGDRVAIGDLDAIIIPSLGADRSGHRIGYGYGYYDEFLAQTSAPKIAPLYDACLVDSVPLEAHDVPMDVLVTERKLMRPGRPAVDE